MCDQTIFNSHGMYLHFLLKLEGKAHMDQWKMMFFSLGRSVDREMDLGDTVLPEGNQTWPPVWELSRHHCLIHWGVRHPRPIRTKT